MMPFLANIQATEFGEPRFPPYLEKAWRTSETVRFLLSVSTWSMMATPPGPCPSYTTSSYVTPSNSPAPFLIARSMVSLGILAAFAAAKAVRSRGLALRSLPPMRAAMLRSLINLVNILPRRASFRAFLCLMVLHLEWPDMAVLPAEKFWPVLPHSGQGVNEEWARQAKEKVRFYKDVGSHRRELGGNKFSPVFPCFFC